jgi:hypothetical protein
MTSAELLTLLSITTPLFCSLAVGWKTARGFGILIGLFVGLALGIGSFFGMRIVLNRMFSRYSKLGETHPGVLWIGLSWLLCVALIVWIFGSTFLGMWFTDFAAHKIAL